MDNIKVTTRVFVRDEIGRFAKRVGDHVDDAMKEAATIGRNKVARMVPPLADSMYVFREGHALYGYASAHPWAEGLDQGIPAHYIPANFEDERWPEGFLANKKEKFFARGPGVQHPGVEPGLFFERSYAEIVAAMPGILQKHKVVT